MGLFTAGPSPAPTPDWLTQETKTQPATPEQKAKMETEALGVAISQNLSEILKKLAGATAIITLTRLQELADQNEHATVAVPTVAGFIQEIAQSKTRDDKPFLAVTLALTDGEIETMVWPDVLTKTAECWQQHSAVPITGPLSVRSEGLSIAAETVRLLEHDGPRATGEPLVIGISETDNPTGDQAQLHKALRLLLEYPGPDPVSLRIRPTGDRPAVRADLTAITSDAGDPQLRSRLNALAGVTAWQQSNRSEFAKSVA